MRQTVQVKVKIDGKRKKLKLPVFKILREDGGTTQAKGRDGRPRRIWQKRMPKGRKPGEIVRATGSGRLRLCGIGLHLTTNPWAWQRRGRTPTASRSERSAVSEPREAPRA